MRFAIVSATVAAMLVGGAAAHAEVRFGHGVRIGGHDFSNRSYRSAHIQPVARLPGPEGCRRIRHGSYRRGDGSTVRGPMEVCNLRAIPRAERRMRG